LDTCKIGLGGTGYVKIADNLTASQGGRYIYTDRTTQRGVTYSYRILAEFAPISNGGFAYNNVYSLRSDRACIELARDVPLITNVSVLKTDNTTGELFIRWAKPNPSDLDTTQNLPPYHYEVYTNDGFAINNPVLVYRSVPSPFFLSDRDTFFTHSTASLNTNSLNSFARPHTYRIDFYSNGRRIGGSIPASSVFLSVGFGDQKNTLTWQESVPWINLIYQVQRESPTGSNTFVTIGNTNTKEWVDSGLTNGENYCYRIISKGKYLGIAELRDTLYNYSQVACNTPRDTIRPCPPILAANNICNNNGTIPPNSLENYLTWTLKNDDCSKDIASYKIYYAENATTNFRLIATIDSRNDTFFTHQPNAFSLAGCYYVTSIDSTDAPNSGGNESLPSNIVCVDNCPQYDLPNVFTPNGDGANELFVPFKPYYFIEKIDFRVFNRWGEELFYTNDPEIRWNGKSKTGQTVAEDVYFYTCEIYEKRLNGIVKREKPLAGYIHLIRGGR
jgi:gliding motility-associated-like protein